MRGNSTEDHIVAEPPEFIVLTDKRNTYQRDASETRDSFVLGDECFAEDGNYHEHQKLRLILTPEAG